MKNLLATLLIAASFNTFAQSKKEATVNTCKGVPVFVYSEPTNDYEITGQLTDEDALSVLNAVNGESTFRTISESVTVIVDNALRKKKKGKIDFDAIIISNDGKSGSAIKFK
jgi:hypothetical protein